MPKKFTHDQASAVMRVAGLEPLEEYTNTKTPWKCKCLTCGKTVTPALGGVRSGQGGCVFCSNNRVDAKEAIEMMQAAGLEPLEDYTGSNAPWKCKCLTCGRTVKKRYSGVQQGEGGCSYCSNNRVDTKEAIEMMRAAGLEPLEDYTGSNAPWKCKCLTCGRTVTPQYGSIRSGQGGCVHCSYEIRGRNQTLDHEQTSAVMRAAGLEPLEDYTGSNAPWKCKCLTCGKTVTPTYSAVQSGQGGCVHCSYEVRGRNRTLDHEQTSAVMRAAGLEPLEEYTNTKTPWKCKCLTCGETVTPTYSAIQSGQGGCVHCAGNIINLEDAIAVMRAAGLEPLEDYPGSGTPWKCKCLTCGRTVTPQYNSIRSGRGGCVHCSYEIRGRNQTLDHEQTSAVMRAAGLEPLEDYPGNKKPWKCRCVTCGQTVTPSFFAVRAGGGCGHCAGRIVNPEDAIAVMRAAGLEPLEDYPGNKKPWKCKCVACGQIVAPRYGSVRKGGGCAYCAKRGYDLSKPGILYLLRHPELRALKVGITGSETNHDRLSLHENYGWEIIGLWDFIDGPGALEAEKKILGHWRNDLHYPIFLTAKDMPQGGYTETVDSSIADLYETILFIEEVIKTISYS